MVPDLSYELSVVATVRLTDDICITSTLRSVDLLKFSLNVKMISQILRLQTYTTYHSELELDYCGDASDVLSQIQIQQNQISIL